MKTITVSDKIHEDVALLAMAWQITEGEVVARLLREFVKHNAPQDTESDNRNPASDEKVPIHAVYEGKRIEAVYQTSSRSVTITSDRLAGNSYKSPSGAAIAVVQEHNPSVHPNRNGWSFWTVTATGELLQSIRPQ